jgi:hypothetical protein
MIQMKEDARAANATRACCEEKGSRKPGFRIRSCS